MKKLYLTIFLLLFLATSAFAKVNINTANAEELATLSGIGTVKAKAIVKYRKANGKFTNINDLKEVKGIGDKMVDKSTPRPQSANNLPSANHLSPAALRNCSEAGITFLYFQKTFVHIFPAELLCKELVHS